MITALRTCDLLASLIRYPRQDYNERLKTCALALAEDYPAAWDVLQPFLDRVQEMTVEDLEELYTQTFDINPLCCLEVGWQLYGDEYERGAFLVEMRRLLQECRVPESTELPDHLEHVLAALGRMSPESAVDLADKAVLPAIAKMINGLAGKENIFEHVLKSIEGVLKSNREGTKNTKHHEA